MSNSNPQTNSAQPPFLHHPQQLLSPDHDRGHNTGIANIYGIVDLLKKKKWTKEKKLTSDISKPTSKRAVTRSDTVYSAEICCSTISPPSENPSTWAFVDVEISTKNTPMNSVLMMNNNK